MVRSQKGITMAMVIFIIAVVFIIIATIFSYNTNSAVYVSNVNAMEEALHIAEAGINVYMYHLNQDPDFYRDKNGIHIAGNASSDELGLVPSEFDSNDLPKLYKVTTYKNKDTTVGYYQIRVVQPSFNKCLEIISTGWTSANPVIKKTISVKLNYNTFFDYLLFTHANGTYFAGTTIDGHVFSNGDIYYYGTLPSESSLISAGFINTDGDPSIYGDVFENQPGKIFPTYNSKKIEDSIKNEAEKSLATSSIDNKEYPCIITERTCIYLDGSSLTISNIAGDPYDTRMYVDLKNHEPFTIFVDGPVFISGKLNGRLTVYSTDNIYITGKDPTHRPFDKGYYSDYNPSEAELTGGILYENTNISSENNLSDDMLVLIAKKDIIIPTKTWPSCNPPGTTSMYSPSAVVSKDMTIYGTLIAAGDIIVEKYENDGFKFDDCDLKFYGSQLCNSFLQGGVEEDGYGKYIGYYWIYGTYDKRLKNDAPSYLPSYVIDPAYFEWVITAWEEVPNP